MKLRGWFRSVLKVPSGWNNEADYRHAEVLHIAHALTFFGGLLYLCLPAWILNGQRIYLVATVLIAVVGSGLLRAGMLRLSGIWTIGFMWLMFAVGSSTEGGVASGSFGGTLALVVFAGLTYGIGAMVTFSAMSIAAGGLLVYLKMTNGLPFQSLEYSHLNILADFSVFMVITVLFMIVAIRRIDKSTKRFESELRERKKIEEALRESEALYHSFVEHIPAGVFRKDSGGRYTFVNNIFCDLKGLNPEEIIGKTPHELSRYESTIAAEKNDEWQHKQRTLAEQGEDHHSLIMRTGRTIEIEEMYIRPDGTRQYMQVVKSPVFSSDGTVIGSQGIQFDVTEHRLLEHQFIQAQKLEGIGTLAGGIAHDFNNLLAMILGSAEMLRMNIDGQSSLGKYVDRIIEASERGTSISRQLLIFSRPDAPEFKRIALPAIVGELREMLAHFLSKSITIRTEIELQNGIVMGDAGQIHQGILNLAINAGDAMPRGGTLTIRVFRGDAERIRQSFGGPADVSYAAVSVSDTGIGIDAALRGKIFDPFFTTKEKGKGTGLGLSIVHGIVKSHNGFIEVESSPERGTTFTFYLPMAAPQEDEQDQLCGISSPMRDDTILLVDDELLIREMLSEYLEHSGFHVLTASNGEEALELFQKNPRDVKLVITDLGMPQMGGEELLRRLQAIDPSVNVIASSGYLEGTTQNDLKKFGFKEILRKPFKMQDITLAIDAVLNPADAA